VSVYPESKDPPDPGIDLHICQLGREGAVRTAGPWIPPHCHLPPPKWLDAMADEGVKDVCARQPILEQTLEDIAHGLQLTGIFLSHHIPPAMLDGRALTRNRRERPTGIIPQEEALFPPSN
jgi:hypothetical protein